MWYVSVSQLIKCHHNSQLSTQGHANFPRSTSPQPRPTHQELSDPAPKRSLSLE